MVVENEGVNIRGGDLSLLEQAVCVAMILVAPNGIVKTPRVTTWFLSISNRCASQAGAKRAVVLTLTCRRFLCGVVRHCVPKLFT